ncbi:MAG: TraR/DksA family transcriptional regulator, partial [Actinomycetota bacterium]|nr:TraR/DksA family transcriptional regulator [Actinomycetota bacterium]
RSAVQASLSDLRTQLDSLRSATNSSNGDDEHDPEGSTVAFEAAQLETLRQRAEVHLAEVGRAIERLDAGSYGICSRCGRPIGSARLVALPATEFCVACARLRR